MVARALGVSFRQALRSVALTLFPLAFIALFSWASAGSTAGNTSDPVRASAWLYLGVHLIPFSLPSGKLTLLPLLAVLYPMWAIRRGLPTVESAFKKINGARLIYALWYAILSEILAVASIHANVSANLYLTPIFTFTIAIIATLPFNQLRNQAFYFSLYLFAIAMGVASIVFALALAGHLEELKSISVVLGSGIVGGALLTFLQVLYLPNIALATLSYLTGIGFSFGSHTTVNAMHVVTGQVPALPFAVALPTGLHHELRYAPIFWLLLFILLFIFIQRTPKSALGLTRYSISQGLRIFLFVAVIAYFSSGELLTPTLNPLGVFWGRFLAFLVAAFGCAAVLALYLPSLVRRLVNRE
jgi:hypothetical protein